LILVFSNRILIKMSFENRPEIMLAALGFGSFLFISKNKNDVPGSAAAGILAGLAFLSHLNGVIYLAAGAGTLLYLKQYKNAFLYILVGGLVSLTYFADVMLAENGLAIWQYQFLNDPAVQRAFGIGSKLLVMLTYPVMFFHSPEQIALSLLLVFLIWHQRKSLKQLPVPLRVYTVMLMLAFWLVTKKNAGLYLTLFLPFMLVLSYELYKIRPFSSRLLKTVLAIYFVIGIYGTFQIIYKNLTIEYLPVSYSRLRQQIPDQKSGFVPLTFFFNEIERYPRLMAHENFKIQSIMAKSKMSAANMASWANKNGAGFILMDYKYRPEAFYPKAGTRKLPFYKLTFFDGRFAVYQRLRLTKKQLLR
jgi:hypothetical protein